MTVAQQLSFSRLCHEELSREKQRDGIGLYEEKRLHSVLKRWLYDDLSAHEQRITGGDKKRRFVADVLTPDGHIFEIQTGALYPLAKKIAFYMEHTDHPVTVVHPLMARKFVNWILPGSGELVARNPSTLREGVLHGLCELKPFLPYLGNPRFSLLLPAIEADEFRLKDGWGKDGKRGSHRYELIPQRLLEVYRFEKKADYLAAFPADLPAQFTAKEFGKCTRLRGYDLYNLLAVFEGLGAARKCGTRGKATLWERG